MPGIYRCPFVTCVMCSDMPISTSPSFLGAHSIPKHGLNLIPSSILLYFIRVSHGSFLCFSPVDGSTFGTCTKSVLILQSSKHKNLLGIEHNAALHPEQYPQL